ncbi:metal ABC transporter permease [Paenibacillus chitinolyticus]|uniref:metal ABC transporter permease n=1 Tax=Paenibacillus chitinolyticus TaxID=79263 RepID=UPI003556B593
MLTWLEALKDPNTQWILYGSSLLGLSGGVLGSFAYLRKQSLMGDALSHAALPGVCAAFMVTGSKSILGFLAGAAISGLLATLSIGWMTRHSKIKQDTALGIVLSVFFGFGIVLLTQIQHSPSGNQSGLDKFLFGQAASMVMKDVYTMAGVSVLLLLVCSLFYKELKLTSFDTGFAKGIGYPTALLDQFVLLLILIAVVTGIQAVGVVLMAALLITPAVAARYWTEKLGTMVVLSGLFGAISGALGTLFSTIGSNMPTGPLSVLAATAWFLVSLVFGASKGLMPKLLLKWSAYRSVQKAKLPYESKRAQSEGVSVGD